MMLLSIYHTETYSVLLVVDYLREKGFIINRNTKHLPHIKHLGPYQVFLQNYPVFLVVKNLFSVLSGLNFNSLRESNISRYLTNERFKNSLIIWNTLKN